MKLLTLRPAHGAPYGHSGHPAVLVGDDALDLVLARAAIASARTVPDTMRGLLAAGVEGLAAVRRVVDAASDSALRAQLVELGALVPFAQAVLGPVVPDPDLVLSGSMNSHGHLAEMGDAPAEHPCAFHKVRSAISASGAPIVPPPGHGDRLDWEGEFCFVIGKRCHAVSVEQAFDHIAGFTLMNDVSAREYALPFIQAKGAVPAAQAWERNVLGKNYPGFAPIGPVIATKDEFPTPFAYHMETLVNGEVMQTSTQEDLVFGPGEMLSYFSQFYIFEPGDVVSLGSPPGVGMARKPPRFLRAGDVVEVRSPAIGTLVNRVAG